MMQTYMLLAIAVFLLLPACDSYNNADHTVVYEVTGSFDECVVTYEDEDENPQQRAVQLPWQHSIEVTVHRSAIFSAEVEAVCTAPVVETAQTDILFNGRSTWSANEESGKAVEVYSNLLVCYRGAMDSCY